MCCKEINDFKCNLLKCDITICLQGQVTYPIAVNLSLSQS